MNDLSRLAKRLVCSLADSFGGVLVSKTIYQQMLAQRAAAMAELVIPAAAGLKPGLTCVVFSKDRALQLHTLLDTYFSHVASPVPVHVVFGASTPDHARAYEEVATLCANAPVPVHFHPDGGSFKAALLAVLALISTTSVFFLVDDIIFIRPVDLELVAAVDPTRVVLSLRHSPHLRRSYTANMDQPPPAFAPSALSASLLAFRWFEQGNEWSDPWSVDGHVLCTAEVRVIARISQFKAPNSFEIALKTFNEDVKGRAGACFQESVILNLPVNRVQSEVANLSGSVSPDFLLAQWNQGLMLDTAVFETHIPKAPHEEHTLAFRSRG